MKKIYFDCTNCEEKKHIEILTITPFYFIGDCPTCGRRITINRKRFKISNFRR